MSNLRLVIVGVGHLGRIHARLAKSLPEFEIVGVVDPLAANREQVAQEFGLPAFASHREIREPYQAAVIATPTKFHFEIAAELLALGVHCLVEKPITLTSNDAAALVRLAQKANVVLQVGHVERFNPAFLAAHNHLLNPQLLSAVRHAPFTFRSTDVSVVHDLMIHDLDLALATIGSEPVAIAASGGKVIGPNEDWAEARVQFANGYIAQFSASRVHESVQRTLEARGTNGSVRIDFQAKTATLLKHVVTERSWGNGLLHPQARAAFASKSVTDYLVPETLTVRDHNAIQEELREFAAAIRGRCAVRVSGEAGLRAVALAELILAAIASHQQQYRTDCQGQRSFTNPWIESMQRKIA